MTSLMVRDGLGRDTTLGANKRGVVVLGMRCAVPDANVFRQQKHMRRDSVIVVAGGNGVIREGIGL